MYNNWNLQFHRNHKHIGRKNLKLETNLLGEVKVCERLAKNVKRFKTFPNVLHKGLTALTAITGDDSIAEFGTDSGLNVTAALIKTSATASHKNSLKHLHKQPKRIT